MTTVVLNHRVKDFAAWKPFFDADDVRRRSAGARVLKVGTKPEDPNDVVMIFEVDDPNSFQKMAADPELRAVMDKAGVISEPQVVLMLNER